MFGCFNLVIKENNSWIIKIGFLILIMRFLWGSTFLFVEILLNFISIQYSILFAIVCSVVTYLIYFKILLTTGAVNLLLCTIITPSSSIILNAIVISGMIKINEFMGLIVIIFGLIVLDGRIFNKIKNMFKLILFLSSLLYFFY